jgi:hypothetical protein
LAKEAPTCIEAIATSNRTTGITYRLRAVAESEFIVTRSLAKAPLKRSWTLVPSSPLVSRLQP